MKLDSGPRGALIPQVHDDAGILMSGADPHIIKGVFFLIFPGVHDISPFFPIQVQFKQNSTEESRSEQSE